MPFPFHFSAIISLSAFSVLSSLPASSNDSDDKNVKYFVIVPEVPEGLFTLFQSIFLSFIGSQVQAEGLS